MSTRLSTTSSCRPSTSATSSCNGATGCFPNQDDYFGFNNDHTGYVPIVGSREGFLVVNHEYSSYPVPSAGVPERIRVSLRTIRMPPIGPSRP